MIISILCFSQEKEEKESFTFKDAVKDPNYLELMQASEEEFQALKKEALSWPQEKFDKLVDWFVWQVDYHEKGGELRRLLVHLRPKAQKRLIEILNNNNHHEKLTKVIETDRLPEAPFHRVCYLIENKPSDKFIDPLLKYSKNKHHPIRSGAYEILGKIDNEKLLPIIQKALLDKDTVANDMLRELSFRLTDKKEPTWEKKLFKATLDFSKRKPEAYDDSDPFRDPFGGTESKEYSIKVLFKLDRQTATEIFITQKYLSLKNESLNTLLEILYYEKVKVDRTYLIRLINSLKNKKLEYPESYVLREAICLLGRHQLKEDLPLINQIINLEGKDIAEYGAYALMINSGLEDFDKTLWETLEKEGYKKLNKYQKYYYACHLCNAEINNGGLDQYFFNSYSNHWREALQGFKEMGDTERYKVLKSAIEKFGKNGPSTDRGTRMDQLAEVTNKDEKALDPLTGDYYSCKTPFAVKYAMFVIKNAQHFK